MLRMLMVWALCAVGAAMAAEKPNVVLILIDDLNHYGLPAYGAVSVRSTQGDFEETPLKTPAIDSLAAHGLRCDQAFVHPLCESTRVALMTGMHNGRNFVRCKSLHESQITFGDVFQKAGYATGMYGKWKQSRGTGEVPAERYISRFGWDDYCCFDVTGEGRRFINPFLVRNGKIENHMKRTGVDPETGRRWYGPDICNRAALKFIDDHKDEPFFLYYPLMLVHDEHTPTPDTVPTSEYDEFDLKKVVRKGLKPGDDRKYFPDMIAYTDKMVGKVLTKLDEHGLRDSTLVIVMGDNGAKECFEFKMKDGRVLQGGKGHTRDKGEHVPLIFSQPGVVPVGSRGNFRAYAGVFDVVDIYPTILEACGIEVPNADRIDGISAWSRITGRERGVHREALYKWYNGNNPFTDLSGAVEFAQTAEFKRYGPHKGFPNGRFFDLRNDPHEEAGKRGPQIGWANYHYAGLDVQALTPEQKRAYDALGKVLDENRYVPVKELKVLRGEGPLRAGGSHRLECRIDPEGATRNNLVWVSSDPSVATVDKFGVLTAHRAGEVAITAYSWDDALPVAANLKEAFKTGGVKSSVTVRIGE